MNDVYFPGIREFITTGHGVATRSSGFYFKPCDYCTCANEGDYAGRCLACGAPLPTNHSDGRLEDDYYDDTLGPYYIDGGVRMHNSPYYFDGGVSIRSAPTRYAIWAGGEEKR